MIVLATTLMSQLKQSEIKIPGSTEIACWENGYTSWIKLPGLYETMERLWYKRIGG